MGFSIEKYNPNQHKRQLRQFLQEVYGREDYPLLSETFFDWLFKESPYNQNDYSVILAAKNGEIYGMVGFIPSVFLYPGGSRKACWPINVMVAPKYRGLGLGYFLLRELICDDWFLVNPGSSRPGQVLCEGLGLKTLGTLNRYLFVPDPHRSMPLFNGDKTALAQLNNVIQEVSGKIHEDNRIDETMGHLPDELAISFPPYTMIRNGRFLKWRYTDHPIFEYHLIWDNTDVHKRGLLIYHGEMEPATGLEIWRIVDVFASNESARRLFAYVACKAMGRNVALVDFACASTFLAEAIETAGFIRGDSPVGSGFAYLFQPLSFKKAGILLLVSSENDEMSRADDWYVTRGDSDQDRPNVI